MRKLKDHLAKTKTTQTQFAERLGVSQPTVSDWLSGEVKPSIANLIAISADTGISIDKLVSDFAEDAA